MGEKRRVRDLVDGQTDLAFADQRDYVAGTTTMLYKSNITTVTSSSNKWKKQEVDAAGNLKRVTEPNPAVGEWYTDYAYNDRNQLLTVTDGDDGAAFRDTDSDFRFR